MAVIPRASVQPTKLVPMSDRNSFTGPRIVEVKHLRAFKNEEELISSNTSVRVALFTRHMNKAAHLLGCDCAPLVRRDTAYQGPNTSTPT